MDRRNAVKLLFRHIYVCGTCASGNRRWIWSSSKRSAHNDIYRQHGQGGCISSVRSPSWWQRNSQLTFRSPPSKFQTYANSRQVSQLHVLGELEICAVRGKEWNFTVSCGGEQKFIPWTEDLANGYTTGAWVDVAHQLIADAFGVPQGVRMTLTYINSNGNETQLYDNMNSSSLYSC
jgi:hypothetical protein